MRPTRVAIQVGAATVRIAVAMPGGAPVLVAAVPSKDTDPSLLSEVIGAPPPELVVVHPARWSAERVARCARAMAAAHVSTIAVPLAAASGTGASAVLEVGRAGAEATALHARGVAAWRYGDAGGARLDEAVLRLLAGADGARPDQAEARRVREALSLRPALVARLASGDMWVSAAQLVPALTPVLTRAVALLRAVRPGRGPVLLIGGVARTPLLAELVDAAGLTGAVVASRPDAAAVLGALVLPTQASPPTAYVTGRSAGWLPPLPRRRAGKALAGAAVLGAGAALLGAGQLLEAPATPSAGVLVQYGYRFDVPEGWAHTGGLPERRRSLLTPVEAPEGSDLIAVERSPLGYDAGAEPDRARAELRAEFDTAVAGGSALSGFDPSAVLAGRPVTSYRQDYPHSVVDWFVVLDGDAQLSVGCRHTSSGVARVRSACARVVGSIGRA